MSEYNAEQHVHIADARQAVIEAAKALRVAEHVPGTNDRYFAVHEAKQVFNKAVEALQEARDE